MDFIRGALCAQARGGNGRRSAASATAIAVMNGSVALELAVAALDIGPG